MATDPVFSMGSFWALPFTPTNNQANGIKDNMNMAYATENGKGEAI